MSAPRKTWAPPVWRRRHRGCGSTGGYTCRGPNCNAVTGKTARKRAIEEAAEEAMRRAR